MPNGTLPMRFLTSILLAPSILASSSLALQLRTYDPSEHDRFEGFPAAPVANPTFIFAGVDLTGVGWDTTNLQRQFTLVSPHHFVGANHFRPPIGAEIRFLGSDGSVIQSTVQSLHTIPNGEGQPTDLLLGRLSTPVPASSGVKFLRCHLLDSEAAYIGQALGVLGWTARGGRGNIAAINDFGGDPITNNSGINTTRVMEFSYNSLTGLKDDAFAEGGDSGSPSFVVVNGQAALVGIHTAVLTVATTTTSLDTFIPAYAQEVNAIMEADGYHLSAAAPKSTLLDLTQQNSPAIARAGYPVTLTIDVVNDGRFFAANNLKLDIGLPGSTAISNAGSAGWVVDASSGTATALRGGLAAGASTRLTLSFTPTAPGTINQSLGLSSDESDPVSSTNPLEVVESFVSWSAGLADRSPGGDDDDDGFCNLIEYAQGGDPLENSRRVAGTETPLGLRIVAAETNEAGTRQIVRFVRRTDASQRLLTYRIESSPTLGSELWTDVTSSSMELEKNPLTPGFETVDLALPSFSESHSFTRLRIELGE